jgi:hypothetical protein
VLPELDELEASSPEYALVGVYAPEVPEVEEYCPGVYEACLVVVP